MPLDARYHDPWWFMHDQQPSLESSTGLPGQTGVNTRPGSDDDGWESPGPVRLRDGSMVRLFKDGEALRAAYDAISAARVRVLAEFYIFKPDATGQAFIDLLARKASQGVQVYLIYDSFGSLNTRPLLRPLTRLGVKLAEFHPVYPWDLHFGWRPFNRDHRKLVVVDDRVAGVGGLNIADPYAGTWVSPRVRLAPDKLWRDTAIGVTGPAVGMFTTAFAKTWNYIHHGGRIRRCEHVANISFPKPGKGQRIGKASEAYRRELDQHKIIRPRAQEIGVLAHAPTLSSPLRPLLHRLFRDARESIDLTMGYFAPDDQLVDRLCECAKRGVRTRLMLANRADINIMTFAARAFYRRLLDAGVEVFERQHVILHAKTLCVDRELSIVGSTNLDYRSIEFNCEISAFIRSQPFAAQLTDLFEHDVSFARRIDPEAWRRRPLRDRFIPWAVDRLRYVL